MPQRYVAVARLCESFWSNGSRKSSGFCELGHVDHRLSLQIDEGFLKVMWSAWNFPGWKKRSTTPKIAGSLLRVITKHWPTRRNHHCGKPLHPCLGNPLPSPTQMVF